MAEDLKPLLEELTRQVGRVAWAIETNARLMMVSETHFAAPCRCCSCSLVPSDARFCPACGTALRE